MEYGFAIRRDDFEKVDFRDRTDEISAAAENKDLFCSVSGRVLEGSAGTDGGTVLQANPNTHLLYRRTAIPGVRYLLDAGRSVIQSEIVGRVK